MTLVTAASLDTIWEVQDYNLCSFPPHESPIKKVCVGDSCLLHCSAEQEFLLHVLNVQNLQMGILLLGV